MNPLNQLLKVWQAEPILVLVAADALVMVAIGFGVPISFDQKTYIDAAIGAISAIIARSQVVPAAKVA
jgi:hypothetical protein